MLSVKTAGRKRRPVRRAKPTAAQFYAVLLYRLSLAVLLTIVILNVKGN